jgi:predicted lipid-binding transport protein (Tim44 family)
MLTSRFAKFASVVAAAVMVFSLAAAGSAEARMGGSFGSRGFRTFQSAPATNTSPFVTSPIQRSMTPNTGPSTPYSNGVQNTFGQSRPSFWSGFGGGIVGGMLGGLLFHGLFGSMLGYGFGGIGGGFSLIFQLLLIGGLVFWALRRFRSQPAAPRAGNNSFGFDTPNYPQGQPSYGAGYGGGVNPATRDEIGITNADLVSFERLLANVQDAFTREDHQGLRQLTTPEMVSYFSEELADNATHGVKNEVSDLKFLDGGVSEAWRESSRDYATMAMHWSAIDVMRDRSTGALVKGDADKPVEAIELWTFVRENGSDWRLSAIQEARGK